MEGLSSPDAAQRSRPRRYPEDRNRQRRSPARPFQRRQTRPAFAPFLCRLSHHHPESRQGRAALLSAPHRRSVGLRHRRDLGAGLLGRRLAGLRGTEPQEGGSTARMGYTPAGYSEIGGSYTFHFPDGNASIARLLVRKLIPGSIEGHDAATSSPPRRTIPNSMARRAVRIRLNQIAVRARNAGKGVEVAYTEARAASPSSGAGQGLRAGQLEHDDPLSGARNCPRRRKRRCTG